MVPLDLRLVKRGLLKRECSTDAGEGVGAVAEKPVDGEAGFAVGTDPGGRVDGVEVFPAGLGSGEGPVTRTAGSMSGSPAGIYAVVEMH